jgi:hypothetical protein
MIKSSAGAGREWRPAKSDAEFDAEILRDTAEAFDAVAEATGVTVPELRAAIATRRTTEGFAA